MFCPPQITPSSLSKLYSASPQSSCPASFHFAISRTLTLPPSAPLLPLLLIDSFPTTDSTSNPDELVTLYNTCLTNTLTSIAPLKTRSVSFSTSAPWFTPELRSMKAKNRQLERLYKRTGLTIHNDMYTSHIAQYKDLISLTKSTYYSGLILTNEGNSKTLFSVLKKILHPPNSLPPPLVLH